MLIRFGCDSKRDRSAIHREAFGRNPWRDSVCCGFAPSDHYLTGDSNALAHIIEHSDVTLVLLSTATWSLLPVTQFLLSYLGIGRILGLAYGRTPTANESGIHWTLIVLVTVVSLYQPWGYGVIGLSCPDPCSCRVTDTSRASVPKS